METVFQLALLVLALGLDTLAVAVTLGISGIKGRNRLRAGLSFALFEGLMPLIGFIAGRGLSGAVGEVSAVVGIGVLFGIGAWTVYESLFRDDERAPAIESAIGLTLTSLSVSLDELAVGFSMGSLGLPTAVTVPLIAAQAFLMTFIGTAAGNRVGERLAGRGETVAGIVLCGLAVLLAVQRASGG